MLEAGAHAATDVTGYGLLGHAGEMMRASGVALRIHSATVPLLPRVGAIAAGGVPGGSKENAVAHAALTTFASNVPQTMRIALSDAQTSGGLLVALPAETRRSCVIAARIGRIHRADRRGARGSRKTRRPQTRAAARARPRDDEFARFGFRRPPPCARRAARIRSTIRGRAGWNTIRRIFGSRIKPSRSCDGSGGCTARAIAAIGIANQRETACSGTAHGVPIANAIVWQDRRTARLCERLKKRGVSRRRPRAHRSADRSRIFPATKIAWLLDNDRRVARTRAARRIASGTVDSWLIWRLTGGSAHVTDVTTHRARCCSTSAAMLGCRTLRCARRFRARCCREVLPSAARLRHVRRRLFGAAIPIARRGRRSAGRACGPSRLRCRTREKYVRHRRFLMPNTGTPHRAQPTDCSRRSHWACGPASVTYALEGSFFRRLGGAMAARRIGIIAKPRPKAKSWRGKSTTAAACISCRRSPEWARRTGIRMRAGTIVGNHARHDARAHRARRVGSDRLQARRSDRCDAARRRRCDRELRVDGGGSQQRFAACRSKRICSACPSCVRRKRRRRRWARRISRDYRPACGRVCASAACAVARAPAIRPAAMNDSERALFANGIAPSARADLGENAVDGSRRGAGAASERTVRYARHRRRCDGPGLRARCRIARILHRTDRSARFCKGTSSRSTKLVHGGVRYLRAGQRLARARGAARAREFRAQCARLRQTAAHFSFRRHPLPNGFSTPLGLKLYDALAGGNDGFRKAER